MPEDILPTIVVNEENTTTTVAKKKRSKTIVLEREIEPKLPKLVIVGRYRSQSTTRRVTPTITVSSTGGGGREKHLTFEGEFKSGRNDGFGSFTGCDGDTYRGNWSVDKKHGYGQKLYSNGDYYETT
ncbi:hypothetical protein LguiA_021601 [Lonicera macranthoides]